MTNKVYTRRNLSTLLNINEKSLLNFKKMVMVSRDNKVI